MAATHIRVKHQFSGRVTNERWIEAGTYHINDPRLFGAAAYLLENDHAEYVSLPDQPAPAEPEQPEAPTVLPRKRGR